MWAVGWNVERCSGVCAVARNVERCAMWNEVSRVWVVTQLDTW